MDRTLSCIGLGVTPAEAHLALQVSLPTRKSTESARTDFRVRVRVRVRGPLFLHPLPEVGVA